MSALLEVYSKEPQMFALTELLRMYAQLPQTEREALDDTIMDQGITNLHTLVDTVRMVNTYFEESSDV